jgi:hypothetical protein
MSPDPTPKELILRHKDHLSYKFKIGLINIARSQLKLKKEEKLSLGI